MCKGLGRWPAYRSRFVCNTSSPISNLLEPPAPGTAVVAVPCPLCQLCQLCQVAQRVPVPCRQYAHMPMPTPGSQCHPLGQRSADQQRAANWADGNSTKRAPATGTDGRRFPTTGCQLLRIVTRAPRENPQLREVTMVAWGGPSAAMRADTPCKYLSPPPAKIRSELCKCNSVLDTGGAVLKHVVVVVHACTRSASS